MSFLRRRQVVLRVLPLEVGFLDRPGPVPGRDVRRVGGLAAVHVLDDLLAVDREVHRLAHALVRPGLVPPRLERHLQLAEGCVQTAQHLEVPDTPERPRDVDRQRRPVDGAGAKSRDTRLLVGQHLHGDPVHVGLTALPEALVPHQLDPVERGEVDQPVRAGADRLTAHVDLVVEALWNDWPVPLPGEEADHARVRRAQRQPHHVLGDGSRVGDRRRDVRSDRRRAGRRRILHVPDRVDDVRGRELLAVVEPHALAEIEGDGVLLDLPGLRERGPDVQPPIELRERVVRVLLAPVGRTGRHTVRRHCDRIGLEPERERSAAARRRRRERPFRGGGGAARECSRGDRPGTYCACLREQLATAEPVAFLGLGRFICHVVPLLLHVDRPSAGHRPAVPPLGRLADREVCGRRRTCRFAPFRNRIQESIVGSTIPPPLSRRMPEHIEGACEDDPYNRRSSGGSPAAEAS